eukprot:4093165-Pyramimonas_sp.AAC.1
MGALEEQRDFGFAMARWKKGVMVDANGEMTVVKGKATGAIMNMVNSDRKKHVKTFDIDALWK